MTDQGNSDEPFTGQQANDQHHVKNQSVDGHKLTENEHSSQPQADQKLQSDNITGNGGSSFVENPNEPESIRKLFVGGISSNMTGEVLRDYYSKFGAVVDTFVPKSKANNAVRGFGFVTFASLSGIDNAMKNRPHIIDGQTLDPKRAIPREKAKLGEKDVKSYRLFVGGITEEHTVDLIKDYFGRFGNVTSVDPINDKVSGKPCSYCFVNFDDYDPADKCILLGHHVLNGSRLRVERALPREQHLREQRSRDREDRRSRSRASYPPQASRNSGSGRFRESYNDGSTRGRNSFRDQQFGVPSNFGPASFNQQRSFGMSNFGSNFPRRNPVEARGRNRLSDGDLHRDSGVYDGSARKRLSEEFEAPLNPYGSGSWSTGSHLPNQPPPWSVQQPMYGQNNWNDQQYAYEQHEWNDQQFMYGRPNLPKQPRYGSRY